MIVDDVEEHHDAAQVRFVDQPFEVVRRAVGVVRRIPQDAVVAPVPLAGKIADRHQLDSGDAGLRDVIELADQAVIGAFGRKRAHMAFEQHGLVPGPTPPIARAPGKGVVVDDLARTGNVLRLKSRRGIGNVDFVVDPEAIARTGGRASHVSGEPAAADRAIWCRDPSTTASTDLAAGAHKRNVALFSL